LALLTSLLLYRPAFLFCRIALGYDEGVTMVKLGREEPMASMDSSGKIIWARHNEIQSVNVKSLGADAEIVSL
jgi:coatomer subunit beta'